MNIKPIMLANIPDIAIVGLVINIIIIEPINNVILAIRDDKL